MGFTGSLQAFLKKIGIGAVNCTPSDCYVRSGVQSFFLFNSVTYCLWKSEVITVSQGWIYWERGCGCVHTALALAKVGAGGVVFS